MALDDANWFTEVCDEGGTAFSLRIREKLHEEQSDYQHIAIYETETYGRLMVIDGFIMLTDRDNFLYHEMMSHPALYTHPAPRRVLIIGGGDCGTLREVLKHPEVERADQVEIDERVTRLAEEYFPALTDANDDERAGLHFGDGIEWVRQAEDDSIDVIIVDSTDPIGPAEGLFDVPFYKECARALSSGGIFVQQSESPLYHTRLLGEIHNGLRDAGFLDVLSLHFPQPVYPSGWWSATMARTDDLIGEPREDDIRDRPFSTQYYNYGTHMGALAAPEFFYRSLNGG